MPQVVADPDEAAQAAEAKRTRKEQQEYSREYGKNIQHIHRLSFHDICKFRTLILDFLTRDETNLGEHNRIALRTESVNQLFVFRRELSVLLCGL